MIEYINKIIEGDSYSILKKFPDACIDLTITSPPYNVGKDYGKDFSDTKQSDDYFSIIKNVMKEVYRVTRIGGRICLNIPFIGNSYLSEKGKHMQFYPSLYIKMMESCGWIFRDLALWIKTHNPETPNDFCCNSSQWGSWKSPSCPYLLCFAEAILVFHKKRKKLQHKGETDITKKEFSEYTKNIWYIPAETKKYHPAPFPEELPNRCIKLYTYKNDIVLDPFMGAGTTAISAIKNGRNYAGIEINPEYVRIARKLISHKRTLDKYLQSR